ncbi:hypothetical protein DPEC_G00183980 [Dallia pectoralis]|uniref:Uncharacterized protein n=1 Tax=Dallia pectoralis TaxID=75939 RepID=A0ACC2GBE9_DALPE|nr:hypothetical protein DPEC_G00183980 [Dallia pectoralis]
MKAFNGLHLERGRETEPWRRGGMTEWAGRCGVLSFAVGVIHAHPALSASSRIHDLMIYGGCRFVSGAASCVNPPDSRHHSSPHPPTTAWRHRNALLCLVPEEGRGMALDTDKDGKTVGCKS